LRRRREEGPLGSALAVGGAIRWGVGWRSLGVNPCYLVPLEPSGSLARREALSTENVPARCGGAVRRPRIGACRRKAIRGPPCVPAARSAPEVHAAPGTIAAGPRDGPQAGVFLHASCQACASAVTGRRLRPDKEFEPWPRLVRFRLAARARGNRREKRAIAMLIQPPRCVGPESLKLAIERDSASHS
jgi:hypothetical protein